MVAKRLAILDFDIENRPLSYLGMDFTTAEVTAIAASFGADRRCYAWLLGKDEPVDMLREFVRMYDRADMVTGHYIRRHDLPIINGALLEFGLPPLSSKLVSDTKVDLLKWTNISKSQESLSAMLGLERPKVHMTQQDWRDANRLTPKGLKLTRARVVGDVRQHQQLREALVKAKFLGPPRLWHPAQ